MKIITKFLIIAAIVAVANTASLNNMRARRTQAKTKDEGNGDWRSGYTCPRVKLNYKNREAVEATNAKFQATQLEGSLGKTNSIGWEFSTGSVGENLKRFVFKNGNNFYIPYRFISGKFVYVNPFGSNKYVSGWLKNDSGETAQLTIDFPYKTFGWFINDEEGNKIASLLTSLGAEHQNIVRANKVGANSAASEYKAAKPLENAATGDEAKLKAEIANQEKRLDELNTSYTSNKTNLENAQKEVVSLRNQLADKEKNVETLNFNINTMAKEMTTIKTNLETLK